MYMEGGQLDSLVEENVAQPARDKWRRLCVEEHCGVVLAVCCSVLQCIAVCRSELQSVMCCSTIWDKWRRIYVEEHCGVVLAVCCSVQQCVAV